MITGRRRRDSDLLRLSQRSNGLAFSHHHFLSASPGPAPKRLHSSVLSQIDGNAPARPREILTVHLKPVEEHGRDDVVAFQQSIRSLIPPVIPIRCKTEPNTIRRRRNSSSSASIKSFTSSTPSRKRKFTPIPTLATMPAEILDSIFQYLPQHDLHALMLTNSNLIEVAASYMYIQPYFTSTYRYAQFTWTVSHKEHYAEMVRILDLSYFGKPVDDHGEIPPQAGWREFKYRHHDMYYVRDRMAAIATTTAIGAKLPNSSHPVPSPFLKSFHRTRDVPIGGICHVLAACQRIRKVNFSRLQIASDFIVSHRSYPASTFKSLIYVSDVPKSWTWQSIELKPIYADEIISWLCKLEYLENIKARSCLWLTTNRVSVLMRYCSPRCSKVDFKESGMQKDVRWAVRGSREEVERIVGEVVENTRVQESEGSG